MKLFFKAFQACHRSIWYHCSSLSMPKCHFCTSFTQDYRHSFIHSCIHPSIHSFHIIHLFSLALQLMSVGQKILGKRLFENVMKRTVYSQFVAGETLPTMKKAVEDLQSDGIGTMLCVPTEEDLSPELEDFKSRWGKKVQTMKSLELSGIGPFLIIVPRRLKSVKINVP